MLFTATIFIRYLVTSNLIQTINLTILPIEYYLDADVAALPFALLGYFGEAVHYCFSRLSSECVSLVFIRRAVHRVSRDVHDFIAL